jgi:cytochrome c-type biogenesis protein CcmH
VSALLPIFAAMTAVAVAALLWPLFRQRGTPERSSFELGVYRDQLAEIDRDVERGLIGPAEAAAARLEIERRILRAAPDPAATAASADPSGGGRRHPVLAAAVQVPVQALGLYAALGAPDLPDRPFASREDRRQGDPEQPNIAAMVARLEARLAESPDDLDGWLMLGRSKGALGDHRAAIEAYRRAQALAADDPRVHAGLGESLVMAAQGVVTPEAKTLFTRLLETAPDDPRPAYYLGWADVQAGDHHAALERWRKLLAVTPAEAPWRPRLIEAVRAAAEELKLDADALLAQIPTPPPATARAATPRQPSEEDMARAADMPPEQQQAMIRSMVERLQARMDVDAGDVEGWLRLAQARLVLGEPARARTTFEQGLRHHPDDPALLKGYAGTLLGPVQAATGLPEIGDKAAELYTKAASLRPDDPEPWWYLGIRALQEGRKDEARTSWRKVLAHLDPSRPEYAAIKERLDQLGG